MNAFVHAFESSLKKSLFGLDADDGGQLRHPISLRGFQRFHDRSMICPLFAHRTVPSRVLIFFR
jgi:hypothetical protein